MNHPRRIWDIQREHLDEAEFLLEMLDNCLDSPKYTLASIQAGVEERLLAHVEGLVIGGVKTRDELLAPVLAEPDDDRFRTAAAVLAALDSGELALVLDSLEAVEEPEGISGLARGLTLSTDSGLVGHLAQGLDQATGPSLVARLWAFAGHRVDARAHLATWLEAGDEATQLAAAHLARHTSDNAGLRPLPALVNSGSAALRWAAIESALIRGLPGAWALVCAESLAPRAPSCRASALAWLAMLGDQATHGRLLSPTAQPDVELLWAWALTGRAEAVERAVELLDHEELGRHAGEVVCTIAGLSAKASDFWLDNGIVPVSDDPHDTLPALEDEPESIAVELGEAALRLPDAAAIRSWWAQRRGDYEPSLRYSCGQIFDGERLRRDLVELPTRLRPARALELAARTRGQAQIETRAPTRVQLAQIAGYAPAIVGVDCQRGFSFA